MDKLRELLKKINGAVPVEENVELAPYTTFKIGGPADILAKPRSLEELRLLVKSAKEVNTPIFILGGGANILVSDKGIRGLTILTADLKSVTIEDNVLSAEAGITVNDLSRIAADNNLKGFEFIYGMPGSLGGAVWMNARCYGSEIADILVSVSYLDENLELQQLNPKDYIFEYKNTPFMTKPWIIVEAKLQLNPGNKDASYNDMIKNEDDRRNKGHFNAPCAGSVFKNNRDFGNPSGVIIDKAGLKGFRIGDAMVSDFHGNIIINAGQATAKDIKKVIEHVQKEVHSKTGFMLEPEVLCVGDWEE